MMSLDLRGQVPRHVQLHQLSRRWLENRFMARQIQDEKEMEHWLAFLALSFPSSLVHSCPFLPLLLGPVFPPSAIRTRLLLGPLFPPTAIRDSRPFRHGPLSRILPALVRTRCEQSLVYQLHGLLPCPFFQSSRWS